jgi:hypothetical protein
VPGVLSMKPINRLRQQFTLPVHSMSGRLGCSIRSRTLMAVFWDGAIIYAGCSLLCALWW